MRNPMGYLSVDDESREYLLSVVPSDRPESRHRNGKIKSFGLMGVINYIRWG